MEWELQYLTMREAAAHLRMSLRMFKQKVLNGEIPFRQFSPHKRMFLQADLDAWADHQLVPAKAKPTRRPGGAKRRVS